MRARHVHLERARADMILVGRGTYLADRPRLDVRLPGLEERSPRRALLTRGERGRRLGNPALARRTSSGFMTSTTCWSKAARRPRPPSSPPTWSTASSSIARRSSSAKASRRFGYVGLDAIADAHGRWRLVDGAAARRRPARSLRARARAPKPRAMFTGIITDIGTVRSAEQRGDLRLTIATGYDLGDDRPRRLDRLLGRVPDRGRQGRRTGSRSMSRRETAVADRGGPVARGRPPQPRARAAHGRRARRPYRHRPCRCGRRRSIGVCPEGDSMRIGVDVPRELGPMIAAKGSITLDGVSLTVNDVARRRRRLDRISRSTSSPTPRRTRRLANLAVGRQLNVEIDVLARYLERMIAARSQ